MTTLNAIKAYYTHGSEYAQDLVEPQPHFVDTTPQEDVEEDVEPELKRFYVRVKETVEVYRNRTYEVYAESEEAIRDMIISGLFIDLDPEIVEDDVEEEVLYVCDDGLDRYVDIDEVY